MITVNGNDAQQAEGRTLAQFLADEGFVLTRVAVEYNGKILPKESYNRQLLADGDVLEVVSFVGGG